MNWNPVITKEPEGYYKLTVPPIDDFAVYAETLEELVQRWGEALECHLQAYYNIGRPIPSVV
jgi:predicted RNase H-like HicB family nuclease